MTVRSQLYSAIRSRLERRMDLAMVAREQGQMDGALGGYPLPLPAALIEVGRIRWSDTSGRQVGTAQVTVRLWLERGGDDYGGSECERMATHEDDLAAQLWDVLEGYCQLNRVADMEVIRGSQRCYQLEMECPVVQDKPERAEQATINEIKVR